LIRSHFCELDAGAFAFVMASGIVSIAAYIDRPIVLSDALLGSC
jgi:hypothetical protein